MLLSVEIKGKSGKKNNDLVVFAADAGATKTHFGLYRTGKNGITTIHEKKYHSVDYLNIIDPAEQFLKELPRPDVISFGVAGPVIHGKAKLANLNWEIDSREISSRFKTTNMFLINDLEATAYGLAVLEQKDRYTLHPGDSKIGGNAAIIAPGTGLGEAGLYWDGQSYYPFATEGGHTDFAARNSFDFELYNWLQQKFGHVSWERLVCGPGIANIFQFLREKKNRTISASFSSAIAKAGTDLPALISHYASEEPICKETLSLFIRYLAHESANLVLKLKATGGLYIGGGIAPQLIRLFEENNFNKSYCQSGRVNYLLEKTPVHIILNTKTALLGAAFYGTNS